MTTTTTTMMMMMMMMTTPWVMVHGLMPKWRH